MGGCFRPPFVATVEAFTRGCDIIRVMKVAVIGSREFPDENKVREYVRNLPTGSIVVSGGARGVDSWAEDEAKRNGLEVIVFAADWQKYGRRAGALRNTTIIETADVVAAFWDGVSRGTADSIRKAKDADKSVEIFR